LFDYSYEIDEKLDEKLNVFAFSLKIRLAIRPRLLPGFQDDKRKVVRLFSWKNDYYREWGELYNHDYSQDKECTQKIFGILKQQKGPPEFCAYGNPGSRLLPTFISKILLYDKDGQKISKKPNTWTREFGEITTPQGPIRSTLQFSDTMPSVATMARNLVDSATRYQEINEMDWQPIKGDPNPP